MDHLDGNGEAERVGLKLLELGKNNRNLVKGVKR